MELLALLGPLTLRVHGRDTCCVPMIDVTTCEEADVQFLRMLPKHMKIFTSLCFIFSFPIFQVVSHIFHVTLKKLFWYLRFESFL